MDSTTRFARLENIELGPVEFEDSEPEDVENVPFPKRPWQKAAHRKKFKYVDEDAENKNALKCEPNTLSNQFPENCFYEKLVSELNSDAPDAKPDANDAANDAAPMTQPLRIVVTQAPEQEHGLFDLIRDYLAQTLSVPVHVEFVQKWGDVKPRIESGEVDMAFMESLPFTESIASKDSCIQHLPVAPNYGQLNLLYLQPATKQDSPKTYNVPIHHPVVLVRRDTLKTHPYTSFHDVKGQKCAFSHGESATCNLLMQMKQGEMGYRYNFFTPIMTGDDQASIQALIRGEVRFAVVDGLAFIAAARRNPWLVHADNHEALVVFKKWRPLPVPPIAVRKALPDSTKLTICHALLNMSKSESWAEGLKHHGIASFVPRPLAAFNNLHQWNQEWKHRQNIWEDVPVSY